MFEDLTTRQREVFEFVKSKIDKGVPPTVREIVDHFGFTAPNGGSCHLKALEKKGYIERDANSARAIRLTDAAKEQDGIPVIDLSKVDRA